MVCEKGNDRSSDVSDTRLGGLRARAVCLVCVCKVIAANLSGHALVHYQEEDEDSQDSHIHVVQSTIGDDEEDGRDDPATASASFATGSPYERTYWISGRPVHANPYRPIGNARPMKAA